MVYLHFLYLEIEEGNGTTPFSMFFHVKIEGRDSVSELTGKNLRYDSLEYTKPSADEAKLYIVCLHDRQS